MPDEESVRAVLPGRGAVRFAYFVVPVFNERDNVERVLQDLAVLEAQASQAVDHVATLVVDDGSTDGTGPRLAAGGGPGMTVLTHPVNRGPGAAFATAFGYLLARGLGPEDLVVTLEGDATSDPAVFPRMLKRLDEGDDLVLASPYLYGGGFSQVGLRRVAVSHIGNGLSKLILNIRGLASFSCFFRIYRGRLILALSQAYGGCIVSSNGFECAAEVLMKAVRLGSPISEVPFRVDWTRRQGRSKMRVMKTSLGYFRLFARFALRPTREAPVRADRFVVPVDRVETP